MRLTKKYICYLFLTLVLKTSASILGRNDIAEASHRVRVRRQDGYVYDKPSVYFDLPSRSTTITSTTESTQAPTVDRTLAQQMYYAYPVPAGGDTVTISKTASTTTGTTATSAPTGGGTSGYNYRSSTTANAGYNYGTPTTAAQINTANQVTNTATQTTVTNSATSTGSIQIGAGYGYNAPSPALSPTIKGPTEVSTNAPKYLPPTSSGGSTVNIGGASASSGTGQVQTGSITTTQTGSTSVGIPSDTYLPPLDSTNVSQTSLGGSVSVPSTQYLPPKTSPSPALSSTPGPTSTPQPVAPIGAYIPPSNAGQNTGTVSTPASRYLPPGFF